MRPASLCLLLIVAACTPINLAQLQENNLAYVFCTQGEGPPMTGGGYVVVIGVKQGFEGQIAVQDQCKVMVDHYLPYKEKVTEWAAEQRQKKGTF